MQAILFGLISYSTWGSGVFLESIVARRLRTYSLVFWGFALSSIVLTFFAPFAPGNLSNLTFGLLIFIIGIGISGLLLGTIIYYEALKIGNRAVVGTIASSFPAVIVLVSVLFLHEPVSIKQLVAILIIFGGVILSSLNLSELRRGILLNRATFLALLTMLTWGVWMALLKIPVSKVGWFWPNYITLLLFPLVFLYLKIRGFSLELPTKNRAFVPLVASTVLVRVAEFSYFFGISKGLVTIVAPIAGANPTLFVVLAFLFFKDKITRQQIAGIIITLTGIVLLSVSSI